MRRRGQLAHNANPGVTLNESAWRAATAVAAMTAALVLPAYAAAAKPGQAGADDALQQARAAFDADPGADPEAAGRDVTLALRDLALAMPRLEGGERQQAKAILARPTDPNDQFQDSYTVAEAAPLCSVHFCVHYVTSTADAPNLADVNPVNGVPDYVEAIAAAAEFSYGVENGALGWPPPKPDGSIGGDSNKTDIYLVNVGDQRVFGYAAVDPPPAQRRCGRKCFAYLVLDNDFSPAEFGYPDPGIPLRVTMAHEYNHILQFGIDTIQDRWLFESTAVWAEEKVFPNDNDYINYLTTFANTPNVPITDANGGKGLRIYGLAVFQHWLDGGEGNFGPSVVLGEWLNSTKTKPEDFAIASTDRAIRKRGGPGFASEFTEFAAASAEWRTAGPFPDAALYPDVERKGTLNPGRRANAVLDHTTYQLFNIDPTTKPKLKLRIKAPKKVQVGLALIGRDDQTATVTRKAKLLKNGGRGSVTLTGPANYERLTAAVVNADGKVKGFDPRKGDWVYNNNNVKVRAQLSG
jgi:hypothetical protein